MNKPKTYHHLFFDLDHTLWDFDTNAMLALQDLFDEMQLQSRINATFQEFHKHYLHHNKILWDRYHNGFITSEELKWKRMWRTLLEFKIGDETLAREMAVQFLDFLPTKKAVFPHTFELLDYLSAKDYQLHLITNGFEKVQHTKLLHSGLHKYFAQVITSEGSNSMKPKKEIFDFALQKTGAQLHNSIMIGDNPDADIAGAVNYGMDCIFVNHTNEKILLKPTFEVSCLSELKEVF